MTVTITVTDPASGRSISWTALNRRSALQQAKLEVAQGAKVVVTRAGKVLFSNVQQ